MRFLAIITVWAGLASATPIDSGSCNGGGSGAEFAALTQGCRQFGWTFGPLSITEGGIDLANAQIYIYDASLINNDVAVRVVMSLTVGAFPVTSLQLRAFPIESLQYGPDSDFLRNLVQRTGTVFSGDSSQVIFSMRFDQRFFASGLYETEQVFSLPQTPEPATFGYLALGIVALLLKNRQPG